MDTTTQQTAMRRVLLLSLGLILFAAMGLLIYGQLVGPTTSSQLGALGSGGSARQALAPAARLAAQWQADASLVQVSGQWSAAGAQPSVEVLWSFQFYSPSTQRLALVVVEHGEVRLLREGLSPYALPTFPAGDWRVDSDQAWQTWWERGGRRVATQGGGVDMVMQLRAPGQGERPVWYVIGLIAGSDSGFSITLDASDGTVLGS